MPQIKKKKFFPVDIPLINSSLDILAYSIGQLNNKTIKLDLTRQLRGKSIEIVFKIKLENDKAIAEPASLMLLPFFIRRMIRKGVNYVEDSFLCECANGVLRIKPFLITRKKVSRAVRKALREEAKEWLKDYVKNKPCEDVFSDTIGNRIQKPLSLKLKKIYPLALCEVRALKVESKKEQEKLKIEEVKIEKEGNEKKTGKSKEKEIKKE